MAPDRNQSLAQSSSDEIWRESDVSKLDILAMEKEALLTEVTRVRDSIEVLLWRDQLYSEPPSREHLFFMLDELSRILKNFS